MWMVGSVAAVVGLVVVIAALVLDRPVEAEPAARVIGPGLPRPSEVRHLDFPTACWGGYDHRAVDTELAALADRYEALYLAAGPSVIAEAERRLDAERSPARTVGDEAGPSAEELEDGGGDGSRVLDR